MAHFAKLGPGNIVERVEVVANDIATTEEKGVEFLKSLHGNDTVWVQTSYNSNIRKNYAGVGYTYYQNLDAFIEPKPFNSWILDHETCLWEAPTPHPNDGKRYSWDEDNKTWYEFI